MRSTKPRRVTGQRTWTVLFRHHTVTLDQRARLVRSCYSASHGQVLAGRMLSSLMGWSAAQLPMAANSALLHVRRTFGIPMYDEAQQSVPQLLWQLNLRSGSA